MLWRRYFRSHYLARHDPLYFASDWLHPGTLFNMSASNLIYTSRYWIWVFNDQFISLISCFVYHRDQTTCSLGELIIVCRRTQALTGQGGWIKKHLADMSVRDCGEHTTGSSETSLSTSSSVNNCKLLGSFMASEPMLTPWQQWEIIKMWYMTSKICFHLPASLAAEGLMSCSRMVEQVWPGWCPLWWFSGWERHGSDTNWGQRVQESPS